ncbi:PAAR-like domain-containing protein [Agrobacterium sp. NPDC089420]|uniref:PAAR-like domain-containing protein n=1 Tax=Agrobacterium sp. NPDC089420 TaxID=3363918 RepID=UPI00384A76F1
MPVTKVSARKCASNVIVSTAPDVCWTPVGSSVVAVGYSSIAFLDTTVRYSNTVRNNGQFDFQLNSRTGSSEGHEAGTKKGVKVAGYLGPAHVKVAAPFVFSEGWATCSHRDPAWINRPDPGPIEPVKALGPVEVRGE